MDLIGIRWCVTDWIHMAQDKDHLWIPESRVKPSVTRNNEEFLYSLYGCYFPKDFCYEVNYSGDYV
jgi:hypothetical protein